MRKTIITCLLLAAMTAAVAAGCGGTTATTTGKATTATNTSNATNATVAAIAKDPTSYDGVVVRTEGNYAVGYCSACFLLKDGVSAVRVEVSDTAPLPPKSKLNSRMEVTGKIYVAQGSPNIVAEKIVYK
jgi:uncharacterized protein YdeI (BOF family)